jgi:CRP/FNR family transcriptional regulator, anaerobic regulatory protein
MHETYILKDGWMLLYRITEEGKRLVFPPVLPGEIIGIHKDKNTESPFSALALQDSLVCKVSQLNSLCLNDPKLGMMLSALGEYETVKSEMYMTNIAHSDARHRVAFLILELFRRLELKGLNKGFTISFPLKQNDLGDLLGLSSVHICRTLDGLKEEGLLAIHQQTLTILDYPGLYDLVGEYLQPIIDCDIESTPCYVELE